MHQGIYFQADTQKTIQNYIFNILLTLPFKSIKKTILLHYTAVNHNRRTNNRTTDIDKPISPVVTPSANSLNFQCFRLLLRSLYSWWTCFSVSSMVPLLSIIWVVLFIFSSRDIWASMRSKASSEVSWFLSLSLSNWVSLSLKNILEQDQT